MGPTLRHLLVIAALTAPAASAQDAPPPSSTARAFGAFLGCWSQAPGTVASPGGRSATPLRCIVPGDAPTQLRITDYLADSVVSSELLDAAPRPAEVADRGCRGTHAVTASADGRRLYHAGRYVCTGEREAAERGILALSGDGRLLDVRELESGGNGVIDVRRLAPVPMDRGWPAEVAARIGGDVRAIEAARADASAPLSVAQVAEASVRLPQPIVERWLLARGDAMRIDAATLGALADAGTPGPIVDVLVALAYPAAFSVDPDGRGAIALASTARGDNGNRTNAMYQQWAAQRFSAFCNSPLGLGPWAPLGMVGLRPWGFDIGDNCWQGLGYGAFGWSPWSPFLFGYRPIIVGGTGGVITPVRPVTVIPTVTAPASRGRLVNGRGYQGGGGSAGSGSSRPVTSQAGGTSSGRSAGSTSGSSGGKP
jgi:hypothetical protein